MLSIIGLVLGCRVVKLSVVKRFGVLVRFGCLGLWSVVQGLKFSVWPGFGDSERASWNLLGRLRLVASLEPKPLQGRLGFRFQGFLHTTPAAAAAVAGTRASTKSKSKMLRSCYILKLKPC